MCCNAGGMVGGARSEPLGCSRDGGPAAAMVGASGGFIVRYSLRLFAAALLVHLYIRTTYVGSTRNTRKSFICCMPDLVFCASMFH